MQIPESDWKILRTLKPVALDRFCAQVLDECGAIIGDERKSPHERYLAVYELMRTRDRTLGDAFDDLRRSNALLQLAHIWRLGLIADDEFGRFGTDTQAAVRRILGR